MSTTRSPRAGAAAPGLPAALMLAVVLAAVPAAGGAAAQEAPATAPPTAADWLADGAAGEAGFAAQARRARGVIEPRREAVLSAQLGGRIVELPVDDGESFAEGDLLVAFDCALEQARLAGAQAAREAAGHTLESNRRLAALESVGALELALARAEYAEAEAAVREARVMVEHCRLAAPFPGRVVEALVNEHESVAPGTELIEILDDRTLRVTLIAPSMWLAWLGPGDPFRFRIDETGAEVPARVTMIGARIDPASQSLPVHGELLAAPEEVPGGLIAGMSGTAVFPEPEG
jgi:RND family efflux transporter MFP subunit